MKTITLTTGDEDYLRDFAAEHGLTVHRGPPSKFIDLSLNNHPVISIGLHTDGEFDWSVYPLGTKGRPRRKAMGYAPSFHLALGDAEATLRHFLRNIAIPEVTAFWGEDIFAKLSGDVEAEVASLIGRGESGSVCVEGGEG
jgi:hypothetical protein